MIPMHHVRCRAFLAGLLGVLLLVPAPGARPAEGVKGGLSTKSFFLFPEDGSIDLERPEDRDKLRAMVNVKTIEFANAFVRDLKGGRFATEIDRVIDAAGGGGARQKLLDFLEGLAPIEGVAATATTIPDDKKAALKKIQLAWTLVQLVRYGAPGHRATYDQGGEAGAVDEFGEKVDGDRVFLERIRAFENDYERFVEIARLGESSARPTEDPAEKLYQGLSAMIGGAGLANPPPEATLRALASAIVTRYLTPADQVWRINLSWHGFSESSPEVASRSNAAFMASGGQVLSWSLPRMDLDDPEAARDEIGLAYEFSFGGKGWTWPGNGPGDFPGSWGGATASGIQFATDPASFAWQPGMLPVPSQEFKVLESLEVTAKATDMEVRDQSLVVSGQDTEADTLQVQDVVKSYWKQLDAFSDIPGNPGDVGTSVTAPGGGGGPDPTGRFSIGGGGGGFP